MANFTVAAEWHNNDGEDVAELYGSFGTRKRAQAEADRINKALEKVPVPEELMGTRSVSASVRPLNPVRIRPIVEEARHFLEPDESGSDGFSYGMYSIDHTQ